MKEINILHTSDIHFDTPFSGLEGIKALKSREELKYVFENIIQICKKERIDIMLIAGDIFDNTSVNKNTLYFIKNSLEKIYDVKVFISPGNHDPINANSFYNMIEWPKNVYVFKNRLEYVVLEELETVVWGIGFSRQYVSESLYRGIHKIQGYNNIAVIHGELGASSIKSEYNPIEEREIMNSNIDYLALGHRHKFSGVNKLGNTYFSYSGCPQGRGFDETGNKGIVTVKIMNGIVDSKFIRTSVRNYYEKIINIDGYFGNNEIRNRIFSEISIDERQKNFYKLILKGEVDSRFNLDQELIQESLKDDFYFVKIYDNTDFLLDIKELVKGYSIKSMFAKKMLNKLKSSKNEEEKEDIKLALKLGIKAINNEEVNIYDN